MNPSFARFSFLSSLVYFLFPKKCVFCGAVLDADAPINICDKCAGDIPFYAGKYLFESGNRGAHGRKLCDRAVCALNYTGHVKRAIARYKFYERKEYGITFAALLCEKLLRVEKGRKYDFAVCVPLSRKRMRERGYNQAAVIARHAAEFFGCPFYDDLLARDEHALRQSTLKRGERYKNVQSAFWVDETAARKLPLADNSPPSCNLPIAGARILLIDDVATSLSTLNACAAALKAAGAAEVVGAVVAAP